MLIPPRQGSGLGRTFKETSEAIEKGLVQYGAGGGEGHGGTGTRSAQGHDGEMRDCRAERVRLCKVTTPLYGTCHSHRFW